jgi:hypothetical protein
VTGRVLSTGSARFAGDGTAAVTEFGPLAGDRNRKVTEFAERPCSRPSGGADPGVGGLPSTGLLPWTDILGCFTLTDGNEAAGGWVSHGDDAAHARPSAFVMKRGYACGLWNLSGA